MFAEKRFTWVYAPFEELAPFVCCKTVSGPIYTSRLCSCNSPTAVSVAAGYPSPVYKGYTEAAQLNLQIPLVVTAVKLLMHTASGISIQDPAQES